MKRDLIEVEPGVFSALVDGRSYELRVDGDTVTFRGKQVATADEGSVANGKAPQGPLKIRTPMPGKVVRVLAAEGARVLAGEGIVVVEAMKMQNVLKAPRVGIVRNLRCVEGGTVAAGEVLAVIE